MWPAAIECVLIISCGRDRETGEGHCLLYIPPGAGTNIVSRQDGRAGAHVAGRQRPDEDTWRWRVRPSGSARPVQTKEVASRRLQANGEAPCRVLADTAYQTRTRLLVSDRCVLPHVLWTPTNRGRARCEPGSPVLRAGRSEDPGRWRRREQRRYFLFSGVASPSPSALHVVWYGGARQLLASCGRDGVHVARQVGPARPRLLTPTPRTPAPLGSAQLPSFHVSIHTSDSSQPSRFLLTLVQ
jgi:hypothetical protein